MPTLKIQTKNGLAILSDSFDPMKVSSSSPIFKAVEGVFDQWFSNQCQDTKDMYYSEDAIYSVRGAIIAGIENVIEYMLEKNISYMTTRQFADIDIAAAFE